MWTWVPAWDLRLWSLSKLYLGCDFVISKNHNKPITTNIHHNGQDLELESGSCHTSYVNSSLNALSDIAPYVYLYRQIGIYVFGWEGGAMVPPGVLDWHLIGQKREDHQGKKPFHHTYLVIRASFILQFHPTSECSQISFVQAGGVCSLIAATSLAKSGSNLTVNLSGGLRISYVITYLQDF